MRTKKQILAKLEKVKKEIAKVNNWSLEEHSDWCDGSPQVGANDVNLTKAFILTWVLEEIE